VRGVVAARRHSGTRDVVAIDGIWRVLRSG
jgi:hypothetical protein